MSRLDDLQVLKRRVLLDESGLREDVDERLTAPVDRLGRLVGVELDRDVVEPEARERREDVLDRVDVDAL